MTCAVPAAEASNTVLRYVEEVECWNQDPNGASEAIPWPDPPANTSTKLVEVPFTGESFALEKATRRSAEINPGGLVSRRILQSRESSGGFGIEWQWLAYDPFLLAAIRAAAWGTVANNTATVTVTGTTNTFAGTSIALNVAVGDWVRIRGCVQDANNGFFKVATRADANTFTTVQTAPVDEGPTALVEVYGRKAVNGSAKRSFMFEVDFSDLANDGRYKRMTGCRPNFALNMTTEDITGSIDTIGSIPAMGDASSGDGSPTAKTVRTPFNTESNINLVLVDDVAQDLMSAWSIQINNELATQRVIKHGAVDVRRGQLDITGGLTLQHASGTHFLNNIGHEPFSIVQSFHDDEDHVDGNSYIIELPRVVFTGGTPQATANGQPAVGDYAWGAEVDTRGYAIVVHSFPATVS